MTKQSVPQQQFRLNGIQAIGPDPVSRRGGLTGTIAAHFKGESHVAQE
jgi:hypothetical protein